MRFQNILALAPLVQAMDLLEFDSTDSNSTLLAKRDDCLDIDSNKPPVSSYFSFNPVPACSPKYSLDSDGSCASHISTKNGCNAYCEEKRFWFFGKPVAINSGNMCTPGKCSQSESKSFAVAKTWTIQAGINGKELSTLVAAFTAGASFAKAETTTKGTSSDRDRADTSTCGDWFVAPIFQASCGTVSSKRVEKRTIVNPTGGYSYVEYCKGDADTTKKVCDVAPMLDADGNPKHQTIFVVKDCKTREFLVPDVQTAAFNQVVDWEEYYENVVAWSSKV